MDIWLSAFQFIACAGIIVVAATFLSKSADRIAEETGFGKLLIGSVLLAGATSLPELTVDISAVRLGAADLAVGDLLGSCLANLLILAVLDLMQRSAGGMLTRRAARHALSGSMSTALLGVAGLTCLTAKSTGFPTLLGVAPGLWILAVVYIGGIRIVYLDQRALAAQQELLKPAEGRGRQLPGALLSFAASAGAIVLAGPFMARAAEHLASATGMGTTFVGTTLVALTTSLPEFVASLAAVRMGSWDLAIGNVFGSNSFNMLLLVPLDFVQPGSLMAVVSGSHVITCLCAILGTQAVITGQLYNLEGRCKFIDPDAWLVIAIVVVGLALVYSVR